MKFKYLTILLFALLTISCGDDSSRDDFIGTWTGMITCDGNSDDNSFVITAGSNDDEILIDDSDDPFTATVDGNEATFSFTEDEETITGSFTVNGNTMTLAATITDIASGDTFSCTGTLTKA
jgi:hypothetical protein